MPPKENEGKIIAFSLPVHSAHLAAQAIAVLLVSTGVDGAERCSWAGSDAGHPAQPSLGDFPSSVHVSLCNCIAFYMVTEGDCFGQTHMQMITPSLKSSSGLLHSPVLESRVYCNGLIFFNDQWLHWQSGKRIPRRRELGGRCNKPGVCCAERTGQNKTSTSGHLPSVRCGVFLGGLT